MPRARRGPGRGGGGGAAPSVAIVFALAISVVGLPWAVRQAVRWYFVPQAVVLDGARGTQALEASARAVAGRWWRTLVASAALTVVGASLGPLLGIGLIVFSSVPVASVGLISSVVYAATVPLAVIGATLLYADRVPDR